MRKRTVVDFGGRTGIRSIFIGKNGEFKVLCPITKEALKSIKKSKGEDNRQRIKPNRPKITILNKKKEEQQENNLKTINRRTSPFQIKIVFNKTTDDTSLFIQQKDNEETFKRLLLKDSKLIHFRSLFFILLRLFLNLEISPDEFHLTDQERILLAEILFKKDKEVTPDR